MFASRTILQFTSWEPKRIRIVGLGEILWDLFSGKKQLGGAPANFAYMTSLLGDDAKIASRVGRDALGAEAIQALKSLHLDVSQLQEDDLHPTGTVIVSVNSGGQPMYQITEGVAWDFLQRIDALDELGAAGRRGLFRLAGPALGGLARNDLGFLASPSA